MRLLDRYLLKALILPFVFGLGVFSVIVLGDIARSFGSLAFAENVPTRALLKYLALRIPSVVVLSLPVGTLLGVCMTMNRLTGHNETTAMRAGGIGLWRIAYPLLAAGLVMSATDFVLNEAVVPRANETALRTWGEITLSQPLLRAESNIAVRDERGHFYFLGHLEPRTNTITNVYINEPVAAGAFEEGPRGARDWVVPRRIIVAERAQYRGREWTLYDGAEYRLDAQGRLRSWAHFERKPYELRKALQRYLADERSPYEMDARELRRRIEVLETAGRDATIERVGLQFKYAVPLACF
ncbi:MAG: LptF/LptG family permease, partial [Armatimonadota bacterium]